MRRCVAILMLCAMTLPCIAVAGEGQSGQAVPSSGGPPISGSIEPGRTHPAPEIPVDTRRMRVGVFELPPYAMRAGDGDWRGLAVTLFREVAQRLGMRYDFVAYPDVASAMKDLAEDRLDFLAVGLDPTPDREALIDFSHAFEQSGTSAVVRQDHSPSLLGMWRQIASSNLPLMLAWVLGCMFAVALIMTVLERRRNASHFGGSWIKSLGESLWWSVTTMSTVGYGDRVPVTSLGRLLGGTWMLLAFALMSVLAGVIASELTVSRFKPEVRSLAALPRLRVGAVNESAAMMDAESHGMKPGNFRTLTDALEALRAREIDAVLGDTAALKYLVRESFSQDLTVLPEPLVVEYACLPLSPKLGHPLRDPFNYWVLRIIESASWQTYRRVVSGEN